MEELEEMKEAFDNLTKSALQLNEMYKKKSKIIEKKDKEIQRLNNIIYKVIGDLEDVRERLNCYGDDNFKIDMSMLTFWIDLLKEYKVGVDKE